MKGGIKRRSTVILQKIVSDIERNNSEKKKTIIKVEPDYKPLEHIIEHNMEDVNMKTFIRSLNEGDRRKSIITAKDISEQLKELNLKTFESVQMNEEVKTPIKKREPNKYNTESKGNEKSVIVSSKRKGKFISLKENLSTTKYSLSKKLKPQPSSLSKTQKNWKTEYSNSSEESIFEKSDISLVKSERKKRIMRFSKAFSPEYYVGGKSGKKIKTEGLKELPTFVQNLVMGGKRMYSRRNKQMNDHMYRNASILFRKMMEDQESDPEIVKSNLSSSIHVCESMISNVRDYSILSKHFTFLIETTKHRDTRALNLYLLKIFSKILVYLKEYTLAKMWVKRGISMATKGEFFYEKMIFFKYLGIILQEKSDLRKARSYFVKMLHYSWILKCLNSEMKAYDFLGINHYLSGEMDFAKFYHKKMIDGRTEDENSVARSVAMSSVNKKIEIRRKFRHTFGREKDSSSEEEPTDIFSLKIKEGETQGDYNLGQKLLSTGSKWKTPKSFEFKVTFIKKQKIYLSHLSRNRSLANYNRESGMNQIINSSNEEIMITFSEGEFISTILKKMNSTLMMLLAVFKIKCDSVEKKKSKQTNELKINLMQVKEQPSPNMATVMRLMSTKNLKKLNSYIEKNSRVSLE